MTLQTWMNSRRRYLFRLNVQAYEKTDAEQVDTISKAVDPGKFKDEKKWPD